MILITGATGHLGKATLKFLTAQNPQLKTAALVRDLDKAGDLAATGTELRKGDYGDYASLLQAFAGVDTLFFVSSSDIQNRDAQQANVVKAAKEAGVKHIVYTSSQRKTEDGTSPIAFIAGAHIETEKQIKASGIPYTILKNALYLDLLPGMVGETIPEGRPLALPAGKGKTAFALREDMAEASARVLAGSGHENKTYEISGTESVSFDDIAHILQGILGRPVTYTDTTPEAYTEAAGRAGVPAEASAFWVAFLAAIKQGEFDFPGTELKNLLGREPVSVKTYLQSVYAPAKA